MSQLPVTKEMVIRKFARGIAKAWGPALLAWLMIGVNIRSHTSLSLSVCAGCYCGESGSHAVQSGKLSIKSVSDIKIGE
jgi:hypothetical protein